MEYKYQVAVAEMLWAIGFDTELPKEEEGKEDPDPIIIKTAHKENEHLRVNFNGKLGWIMLSDLQTSATRFHKFTKKPSELERILESAVDFVCKITGPNQQENEKKS